MKLQKQGFDWPLDQYRTIVQSATLRSRFSAQPLKSSPKYRNGEALPFSGFTLMSTPGALNLHCPSLTHELEALQSYFVENFKSYLIAVPPQHFHVTGADLISGEVFTDQIERQPFDKYKHHLIGALEATLSPQSASTSYTHSNRLWKLQGFSLFESALVALFTPLTASTYASLVQTRAQLYTSKSLIQLGVQPPRPLMLHITLAYFTEHLARDLKAQDRISEALSVYQRRAPLIGPTHSSSEVAKPTEHKLALPLSALSLYFFTDMQSYFPALPSVCFST